MSVANHNTKLLHGALNIINKQTEIFLRLEKNDAIENPSLFTFSHSQYSNSFVMLSFVGCGIVQGIALKGTRITFLMHAITVMERYDTLSIACK